MKKLVKIGNLLKVTMKLHLCLMASLLLMSSAQANTFNTVIDIIEVQADAFLDTSNKALNNLSESLFHDISNAIAIEEIDAYRPNFDDKNVLVNAVEAVHSNLGAKAKLTDSLNSIVTTIEKSSATKNAYKSLKKLGISVRTLEKSANDLFKLARSKDNIKFLKDLSINREDKIDALLFIVKSGSDLQNFISKINSTDSTSSQKNQAIEMLLNQTKLEAANFLKKSLRNEVDQKLFIQDMIVKAWKNSEFINADNYEEFAEITVYDENVSKTFFFFTKKTIDKSMNAKNKYSIEYFQPKKIARKKNVSKRLFLAKKIYEDDSSDYEYERLSPQFVQRLESENREIERKEAEHAAKLPSATKTSATKNRKYQAENSGRARSKASSGVRAAENQVVVRKLCLRHYHWR